jgi:membrane-associated protease RseP (regulator of RpoE activity)
MEQSSASGEGSPLLVDIPRFEGGWRQSAPTPSVRRSIQIPTLNWILFLVTLLTTTMAGASAAGAPLLLSHPILTFPNLLFGLTFSIPLMLILLAHESGHYILSRHHDVDTSLPYFIPGLTASPFLVGTFGAFIRMRAVPKTRQSMFDIGSAGPWAGFVLSIVAIVVGLRLSDVTALDMSQPGFNLGDSIIFWSVGRLVLGVNPDTVTVNLHPIAFAGWWGLFVTALNLLPVGQLDGGHVVYALFGPRGHRIISRAAWFGFLLMALVPYLMHLPYWPGWLTWFVLVLILGLGHPITADANTPLRGFRRIAAWATILLLIITFIPRPFSEAVPTAQSPPNEAPSYSVVYHYPLNLFH